MEKKYGFTEETITTEKGVLLHRIKALRDFGDVKEGDLGGFIECENNLSHDGDCWVYDNACVFDDASVNDNAHIYHNAKVYGRAKVYHYAEIRDEALVVGDAEVFDFAQVSGNSFIFGHAKIYDEAHVYVKADIGGCAEVYGLSRVYDYASIRDYAVVNGNAAILGVAKIFGNVVISEAVICGDAEVKSLKDYIVFKNWWSSGRFFTWTRSNNMWKVGCFYGTGDELIKKAYKDSEESGRHYKEIVEYVEKCAI